MLRGASKEHDSSVANYRKQESLNSHVIDFPIHGFRILPRKGNVATAPPANLKLCQRGEWADRILVETVLSMLTLVCHFQKVMHRAWAYFHARLAFTMAAFNILA
jgi:hypothetical protein